MRALPVCAPYFALLDYRYKAKLTPGTTRRGRAGKAAAELALSSGGAHGDGGSGGKKASAPRTPEDVQRLLERLLVEEVADAELTNQLVANVKVSSQGGGRK